MNFLSQLLRGIAFVPALVSGIESLFANKPGSEKKDAAMLFLQNALSTVDAVAAREDPFALPVANADAGRPLLHHALLSRDTFNDGGIKSRQSFRGHVIQRMLMTHPAHCMAPTAIRFRS